MAYVSNADISDPQFYCDIIDQHKAHDFLQFCVYFDYNESTMNLALWLIFFSYEV